MPPFIDKEGKTSHPFIDVLPAGAENIHHPQTLEFIGQRWREFIDMFTSLTEAERAERLRVLIKNWETAYLAKYEIVQMTGVMLEIRDLAARSSLTAWLARQPIPTSAEVSDFYAKLLSYSTDIMGGHTGPVYKHPGAGVVTPHLAFTAAKVAGLHPEDTVRVDDAGDGLLATFVRNQQRHVQYVDVYSLRRAIFNQMFPQLKIDKHSTASVDVLFTSNTAPSPPHVLIRSVHSGGRLIIYGDRDWHHISAEVISKLKMFSSFEAYAASLPPTLDDSMRIMHIELFANWKGLNKQINGTLHFKGELSTYQSESGVVIVIDNIDGTNTHYEAFNLANPQARPFTDYILSFDAVRKTRRGTSCEVVEHYRHRPEQEKRHKVAKAQREVSSNEEKTSTVVRDTSTQTAAYPTDPRENSEFRNRAFQIEQFCAERDITTLCHFTRIENLRSILTEGLLGRETLEKRLQEGLLKLQKLFINDHSRWDKHKEAVCVSISFPNYLMFSSIRKEKKMTDGISDSGWVVLVLDAKVLWELDCVFCTENAASNAIRHVPLEERRKSDVLESMFVDSYQDVKRNVYQRHLQTPTYYPTHPQAEVLVFDRIQIDYIKEVHFYDESTLKQWRDNNPWINPERLVHNQQYFRDRPHYVADNSDNWDDIPF